uniref:Reverse transcriptase domain-containing protein n=1 Tax=Tanacetum cinerariifolium TaxID=118510 RepID=A0A6L2LSD3_TANCI|nr:hypothetical protein [Tanacetum cinerariifolium]
MNILNETCNSCIYGDGKPITCNECEGMLRGGFCLPCNLKENSFICYQNAYSFNDTSNNSNYLSQPQYENYLCNFCGNNSHDGYDCQQQFPLVYEQEPSYNQNYNDNYYPHDSPSFPCCDNCGGSHETFECQPMDQNIDFPSSDQIQTPQYPDVYPPSQEIRDKVFHAKGDLMKSIQTFWEEFNCIPFEEKPQILLQAWFKFFAIKHAQPEDSNELFQKLLEDLKELAEYVNSPSRDRSNFLNDNEEHSVQYKEHLENSSNEIAASNSNQEKEKPPQDSDIRQLIREEWCIEVCEEQKQNMEDTILELVEICRQKELFCMHDNVDDLIKSALNSKFLSINSQRLNKEKQEVKNVVEQPAERRTQPEYSTSMGYEHPNTTPKTESDEIIRSGVEELVPILSENEVTLEDKRGCDVPVCENSPICDNHSEIFSDSKNDDDISSDDDDFEDIEYVEASLYDPEIVSVAEENVVYQEEEEVNFEDISQIQDVILREKLLSINRLIANIESLNDNPTPDLVLNSSVSFPEESDNSPSDNFSPEFKTFCDHTEETRSGNTTTHANDSLLDIISNDSIPFPNNESSEFDFDNPSVPRPLSEPPDADFEPDYGDEISVVMNNNDKLECLNPRDEFDDDDYFSFMFVIYSKMFLSFLSAESGDTIFNPGISV